MKSKEHVHQQIEAKILPAEGEQVVLQKVLWPNLDSGSGTKGPIALPDEPHAELIKQPDGSTRIIVTCTCGKRVEIKCEF